MAFRLILSTQTQERMNDMKKTITLNKVPRGEVFTAFDEDFVVLDHIDGGGVFCIRKGIWINAAIDENACNKLSEASVLNSLEEYTALLDDRGAKDGDNLFTRTDLKATDGTRVYGWYEGKVSLLTLEQYGQYKEIIPLAGDWWWLATPVWTRWLRSPNTSNTNNVWYVYSDGDDNYGTADVSWGCAPF